MIECLNQECRDALPDLVHGRLGEVDTATLLAHIEGCDACAAELALLREIRATAPIAPSIDVSRIVAALPASVTTAVRPDSPDSRRPGMFARQSLVWKLVAVAAVVVAGIMTFDRTEVPSSATMTARPVATVPAGIAAPAADPSSVAETVVPQAQQPASLSLVAGIQDLTDEQIETLLADLDGIETMPAAEPEQAVIAIDSFEGIQ